MQGNCSAATTLVDQLVAELPSSTAVMRAIAADSAQCLLIADSRFIWTETELWLHNLYIRLKTPIRSHGRQDPGPGDGDNGNATGMLEGEGETENRGTKMFQFIRAAGDASSLFMTNVTLQVRSDVSCSCNLESRER